MVIQQVARYNLEEGPSADKITNALGRRVIIGVSSGAFIEGPVLVSFQILPRIEVSKPGFCVSLTHLHLHITTVQTETIYPDASWRLLGYLTRNESKIIFEANNNNTVSETTPNLKFDAYYSPRTRKGWVTITEGTD